MTPSSEPPPSHPLQPVLADAESELRRRLHEACVAEAKGVSTESTEEIRRLEDKLLAAAVAAQQTIAVRRQMKNRAPAQNEPPIAINKTAGSKRKADPQAEKRPEDSVLNEHSERPATHVREFRDGTGRAWRAWQVIPGLTRASESGRRFLGDFQDGWICFEGLNGTARRRLPRCQPGWENVSDDELQHLLAQAIDAPVRETQRKNKN
jgi:hypothetical protein